MQSSSRFRRVATLTAAALMARAAVACAAERSPAAAPAPAGATATAPPSAAPAPTPVDSADSGASAPPKLVMRQLQEKAIRGMVAAFNAHDAKALAAFYAPNALVRSPARDGWKDETGREPIEKGHAGLFAAFPDVRIATRIVYVSGDTAIWTWISGGSDGASRRFGFRGASVLSFGIDGLITEDHTYFDPRTMAGQLGKLPKGAKVRTVYDVPAEELWWREAKGNQTERKGVELLKRTYDALARGDQKAFLAPLDDKGQYVRMSAPESVEKIGAKAEYTTFQRTFAEPRITSNRIWGVDLEVISETTLTATYSGGGAPARPVTLHFLDIVSITRDGEWILGAETYDNGAELLAQAAPPVKTPAKQ